jgi:hypothetical protein
VKLQRNPTTKKICRSTETEKVVTTPPGEPCGDCDPDANTECPTKHEVDCGAGDPWIAGTYKLTFASTATCTSCVDIGSTSYQGAGSGAINRDFYITGYSVGGEMLYFGRYFAGSNSAFPNAATVTHYTAADDCTGASDTADYLDISMVLNKVGDQQYLALSVDGLAGGRSHYFFLSDITFGLPGVAVTDFCTDDSLDVNNALTACPGDISWNNFGQDGKVTIERCPDCPQDCDCQCAEVAIAGTCDTGENCCPVYEGEYTNCGRTDGFDAQAAGLAPNNPSGGWPTGCVWTYNGQDLVGFNAQSKLYVWYDGADWRAVIAYDFGDGVKHVVFENTSSSGTTIACSGGFLAGSITLSSTQFSTNFLCPSPFYLCEGCEATVTLGACGAGDCPTDNCTTCDDPITVTITGFADDECVFCNEKWNTTATLTQTNCTWSGLDDENGDPITLTCVDGQWVLEFETGFCGGTDPIWTAPASGDGTCPPATGWTYAGTTNQCGTGTLTLS